jgi:hypothetical protein
MRSGSTLYHKNSTDSVRFGSGEGGSNVGQILRKLTAESRRVSTEKTVGRCAGLGRMRAFEPRCYEDERDRERGGKLFGQPQGGGESRS